MNTPAERRNNSRVEFSVPCTVWSGARRYRASTRDLSLGGALVELEPGEKIPGARDGSTCLVELDLGTAGRDVQCDAVAVMARRDGDALGLQFRSVSLDTLEHLKKIIQYNSDASVDMDEEVSSLLDFMLHR